LPEELAILIAPPLSGPSRIDRALCRPVAAPIETDAWPGALDAPEIDLARLAPSTAADPRARIATPSSPDEAPSALTPAGAGERWLPAIAGAFALHAALIAAVLQCSFLSENRTRRTETCRSGEFRVDVESLAIDDGDRMSGLQQPQAARKTDNAGADNDDLSAA
jgi:hypothetical protein